MSDLPALGSNVSGAVRKKVFERLEALGYAIGWRSDSLKVAQRVAQVTGWEVPTIEATHAFLVRFLNEFGEVKQQHDQAAAQQSGGWMRPAYSNAGDSREAREMRRNVGRIAELRAVPSVKDGQLRG